MIMIAGINSRKLDPSPMYADAFVSNISVAASTDAEAMWVSSLPVGFKSDLRDCQFIDIDYYLLTRPSRLEQKTYNLVRLRDCHTTITARILSNRGEQNSSEYNEFQDSRERIFCEPCARRLFVNPGQVTTGWWTFGEVGKWLW
jgi:hypothetical protein